MGALEKPERRTPLVCLVPENTRAARESTQKLAAFRALGGEVILCHDPLMQRMDWSRVDACKGLAKSPFKAERVAVILPQSSSLYENMAQARRQELAFFDLRERLESWAAELAAFEHHALYKRCRILLVSLDA
ncbi:hypothetical protein RSK20926_00770 [Roseobacter sp. SK209-2-6]|uniref:hypothetical protein n=1 Tax=Roseobacter sp. SK209-2-6 TaxID=388739 RepID=UPI0000F3C1D8|nr:hypothetical protein [Roseobacter sp. SK209-2-6]EBA15440.1 hypothetical protein RSK20926_00770 [Roseobacter sp. SK209-2-6]